jgi:hypothetical protein
MVNLHGILHSMTTSRWILHDILIKNDDVGVYLLNLQLRISTDLKIDAG